MDVPKARDPMDSRFHVKKRVFLELKDALLWLQTYNSP